NAVDLRARAITAITEPASDRAYVDPVFCDPVLIARGTRVFIGDREIVAVFISGVLCHHCAISQPVDKALGVLCFAWHRTAQKNAVDWCDLKSQSQKRGQATILRECECSTALSHSPPIANISVYRSPLARLLSLAALCALGAVICYSGSLD